MPELTPVLFLFGNVAGIIGAGQAAIAQDLDLAMLEETLEDAYGAIVEGAC